MATKKYQITSAAEPFVRDGIFRLRLRFRDPKNPSRAVSSRKCPDIEIPYPNGVLAVNDPDAQLFLENMIVPNKTLRDGARRATGKVLLFQEVASSTAHSLQFESHLSDKFEVGKS
jgi:hypothetical protein